MFHSFQGFDQDMEDNWSKHHDPCTYQLKHAPHEMTRPTFSMARLKHQVNVVNNIIRATLGEGHHGMRHASTGTRPTLNAYNSGLTNNSCFSCYNETSMSQHDSRSNFFPKTYSSQLPLQMSNDEFIFEDFMVNQTKQNEEILGRLNSLTSKFNNLATYATQLEKMLENEINQETYSSYRTQDEQNDKMTLQGNGELESFSSLKEIAICYETDSDDDTEFETNEKQEKIEEPKYVAPSSNVFPIFIPHRLNYIEKSNELELKDPPIVFIDDEFEKNEDGDNPLKVEASDVKNDKFTKFDLSPQLGKCLENTDAMNGSNPQIKYRITVGPAMHTPIEENTKHVSRISLIHFWKNYDALNGRKVKIR